MKEFEKTTDGKATFTIQIQFRQNATWQGSIDWVEGGKSRKFRSELEMLKLMMEAVENNGDSEDNNTLGTCTW